MSERTDPGVSFELHAWVDESMRSFNVAEPLYMLGAAIADPSSCESVRDDLRAVRKRVPNCTGEKWTMQPKSSRWTS